MNGTNKIVTIIGGIGVFLTTIGTAGATTLPESYKIYSILCTIIGGGLTAMAFYFAKGKDVTGIDRSNSKQSKEIQ